MCKESKGFGGKRHLSLVFWSAIELYKPLVYRKVSTMWLISSWNPKTLRWFVRAWTPLIHSDHAVSHGFPTKYSRKNKDDQKSSLPLWLKENLPALLYDLPVFPWATGTDRCISTACTQSTKVHCARKRNKQTNKKTGERKRKGGGKRWQEEEGEEEVGGKWKCGPIKSELLGCPVVYRSIHWSFQRNGSSSPTGFINVGL